MRRRMNNLTAFLIVLTIALALGEVTNYVRSAVAKGTWDYRCIYQTETYAIWHEFVGDREVIHCIPAATSFPVPPRKHAAPPGQRT